MHLICSDEKIMCPINMHLICSDNTVYGGPLWNKERSDSSYHWLEPAYLCSKSGDIGLLLFCDAPKLQKTTNPKHFFQKLFHHFSFSLCRYPIVHTFTLPKDSQEDLVNLSMLTQSSSSLRWGHMTHACGGAISLLRWGHEPPCGPMPVVARPPSHGTLLCHRVALHSWWLHLPVKTGSHVTM
jgi:hypothetical protein